MKLDQRLKKDEMCEPCQKKSVFARASEGKIVSDTFKEKQGSRDHVLAGKDQKTRF